MAYRVQAKYSDTYLKSPPRTSITRHTSLTTSKSGGRLGSCRKLARQFTLSL